MLRQTQKVQENLLGFFCNCTRSLVQVLKKYISAAAPSSTSKSIMLPSGLEALVILEPDDRLLLLPKRNCINSLLVKRIAITSI